MLWETNRKALDKMIENSELEKITIELPEIVICYKLNDDETYEVCNSCTPDVYVDVTHSSALWDKQVRAEVKRRYGNYVGVMHKRRLRLPSQAKTESNMRYLLG